MSVTAGVVNVGGPGAALAGKGAAEAEGGLAGGLLGKLKFAGKAGLVGLAAAVGLAVGTAAVGVGRHLGGTGKAGETWKESFVGAAVDLKDSTGFLAKAISNKFGGATDMPEETEKTALAMGAGADVTYKNIHPPVTPTPPINKFGDIYITQDFKDQDPDRVFVAFNRAVSNLADNPTQSSQGSPHPY
jgi:hypothetical protein